VFELYAGHSHQLTMLRRAGVVRDAASISGSGCLSLAGTAKPKTFLRSFTSLMAVQLTFELELRQTSEKNGAGIAISVT